MVAAFQSEGELDCVLCHLDEGTDQDAIYWWASKMHTYAEGVLANAGYAHRSGKFDGRKHFYEDVEDAMHRVDGDLERFQGGPGTVEALHEMRDHIWDMRHALERLDPRMDDQGQEETARVGDREAAGHVSPI
jgi:hypothetical protein